MESILLVILNIAVVLVYVVIYAVLHLIKLIFTYFFNFVETTMYKISSTPLSEKISALIMLGCIALYFRTDTAIGTQWFLSAIFIGILSGIFISMRDTEDTGYNEKYIVGDKYYVIVSGCITICMFLFFAKNNLVCGSTLNQIVTTFLYGTCTEISSFIGKDILKNERACRFSGEEQRLLRHKR